MTANQGRAAPAAVDRAASGPPLSVTERTRHRRLSALGQSDRAWLYAVLDAGLAAHSAMLYGRPRLVDSPAEKLAALRCITEHIAPGQWATTWQQPVPDPALSPGIPVPAHISSRAGTRACGQPPAAPGAKHVARRDLAARKAAER